MKNHRSLLILDRLSIGCIQVYKALRFPLDSALHSVFGFSFSCKHIPTCSVYTIQQIQKHGTIRGLLRGGYRILTCW